MKTIGIEIVAENKQAALAIFNHVIKLSNMTDLWTLAGSLENRKVEFQFFGMPLVLFSKISAQIMEQFVISTLYIKF